MNYHLGLIFPQAGMVDNPSIPKDNNTLRSKITRPVQSGDYEGLNASLTPAENEVERYLTKQGGLDVNLTNITAKFSQPPYGWLETCTLYLVNELVRRHRRDFTYANNRNVDAGVVAAKIVSETSKFSVREGEAIPQDLVNRFLDAWKKIFSISNAIGSNDFTQAYRTAQEKLSAYISNYDKIIFQFRRYNFINPLEELVELLRRWQTIRDITKFFNAVIDDSADAANLMDTCRQVVEFSREQIGKFNDIINFASDNRDNFTFLDEDLKGLAEDLQGLKDKEWPFQIREYIKKKKEIEAALDEIRKQIREEIRQEYEKTYQLLCESAIKEGVDVTFVSEPSSIYSTKCIPGNILALKNNLNTDDYFNKQAYKIQVEIARIKDELKDKEKNKEEEKKDKPKEYPTFITLRLNTKAINLDSEEKVDAYLASLKEKIMEKIRDNKIVSIN